MNDAVLFLFLLDFLCLALLPVVFFRRGGKLHLRWWITAGPYLLSASSLLASYARMLPPFTGYETTATRLCALASVPCAAGSIALIAFTLGTHRRRIALWHQADDAPVEIVTYGAYRRIRHPFYAAFLLMLLGSFVYCPQGITLAALVYGFAVMNHTAAGEERRLLASAFGEEYRNYMERTGRFVPRRRREAG